ncbi:MAG: carboxypeptidase-like regulatory domain-containing protein, partial [Candidatus Sulfotelmatobacter sp.]
MKHELIARRLSRAPFKCLCVILLAAGLVVAQEGSSSIASSQASPESSASAHALLEGIVTRDPGSEPVKKALIELIAESQNDGANYTALTAADGSFRMENIKPGRYRLFVERTGYHEIDKRHRHTE